MNDLKTEQEKFWAGSFGDEYTDRNQSETLLASNISLFSRILLSTSGVCSFLELGANTGINLQAIKSILPISKLSGIELNKYASEKLGRLDGIDVFNQSILDFVPQSEYDFVFAKGVLIHINPNELERVYDLMHKASGKYICIIEYYNPSPVAISYRGHSNKLFKRDFAGEVLDRFADLSLVNYGFVYHKDKYFPQDDVTWFLLEKCK